MWNVVLIAMSKERKQKNLRINEKHAEALEKMAEDYYNSSQKQGQIVEDLINLTDYAPNQLSDAIDDDRAEASQFNVDSADHPNASHTHNSDNGSSEGGSSEDDETEITLENMKGRNVDHADVIHTHIKQNDSRDSWTVDELTDIVQDKAGYSRYRAKQKAERALEKCDFVLDTSEIAERYKNELMENHTNRVSWHTNATINNNKQMKAEFRNLSEEDLFGSEHARTYYTNKRAYDEAKKTWFKGLDITQDHAAIVADVISEYESDSL